MTKTELIKQIATETELPQSKAAECLNTVINAISTALAEGDKVALPGFGTFSVNDRAERLGKNPKTGETLTIKACKMPKFKAGKGLKTQINRI